jgi:hypothetical protein
MLLPTIIFSFYLLGFHGISAHPALFPPKLESGELKGVDLHSQIHQLHKRMEGAFQGMSTLPIIFVSACEGGGHYPLCVFGNVPN